MGYYIKKMEQTAPVQAVTESSLKSASEINVPTVKAVLDGLHYPNLLINGDFQCNQRGQSEYVINQPNTIMFTLDCWQLHATAETTDARVIKLDEGIEIYSNGVNVGLVSYLDIPFKVGMTYLVAMLVDNELVKGTIILTEKDKTYSIVFESGVKSSLNLTYVSSKNKLQLTTYLKNRGHHYIIKYIDLFEGDIAYPHVREDYATALIRCQRKIRPLGRNFIGYSSSSNNHMFIPYTEIAEMKQQSNNISIINKDSAINLCVNGTQLKSTNYFIDLAEDYMHISFNDISIPVNTAIGGWFNSLIIMISSEPL